MSKGCEVIYGRGRLARKCGVGIWIIRYMESLGKIKPKQETLGDMTVNMYTHTDIDNIEKYVEGK